MSAHRTHKNEPLNFVSHPYLKQIYADDSPDLCAKKGTQSGLSEYLYCRAISLASRGRNQFYVLPTDKLIGRVVRERFDKTVEFTSAYKRLVSEFPGATDNVTMKQVGPGTIVFVGSNSAASFTEFAGDDATIDERDKCKQDNLAMVPERLAASKYRFIVQVSQPSFPDEGIAKEFKDSCRFYWFVRCPKCGGWAHPDFYEHVVRHEGGDDWSLLDREWEPGCGRDVRLVHSCGGSLDRRADGEWVAEAPGAPRHGYHIGKEFSTQVTIEDLVGHFSRGLADETEMQRFQNGDRGVEYMPKGAKLDRTDLDACREGYFMPERCAEPCVAGVDVGTWMHVRINQLLPEGRMRAVYIGKVRELADLQALKARYNVVCGVIDALPETRLSRAVATDPRWFRAFFHPQGAKDHEDRILPGTKQVGTDRTVLLDSVRAEVVNRTLALPRNADLIDEYYDHMTASVRYFDEDAQRVEWREGSKPDHLFLAEGYALLARRVLAALGRP